MRVEFSEGFVVALQGSLRRTKRQSWFSMPKQDIHKDISITKCPERFLLDSPVIAHIWSMASFCSLERVKDTAALRSRARAETW